MTEGRTPDAFIFDLDGTLVDTVGTRIEAWLRTFEEEAIPADQAQVAALIGSDGRRLARVVAEAAGLRIDAGRAEAIDHRAGQIYGELNQDPRPLPGVRELLENLERRRFLWAIATSSRREQVDTSVESLRLPRRPLIVDGSHVANAKPAPDLLLQAARELGVEPEGTWYVGDSVWDMQAAETAGMRGVGVTTGAASAPELRRAGASLTVSDLHELAGIVAGLVSPR